MKLQSPLFPKAEKEIREAQAAGEMRRGFLSWTGWASQRNTLEGEDCYKFFDTFNSILKFLSMEGIL